MKTTVPDLPVVSEQYHYRFLHRIFFTGLDEGLQRTFVWHDRATDYYSNLVSISNSNRTAAPQALAQAEELLLSKNRRPCIYTTPHSLPSDLAQSLNEHRYQRAFTDAWMYFSGGAECKLPSGIGIREVQDQDELALFVEIFNRAYSGSDPNEPYGKAPPEWGETVFDSFKKTDPLNHVIYHLLFSGGEAVAVLISVTRDGLAGLYSIGTIPEKRGRGYGGLLTLKAVADLQSRGAHTIFLQTEQNSCNEKFYTKLGFNTRWLGQAWVKK